jgi:hypothetical protein
LAVRVPCNSLGEGPHAPADNHSAIIEFRVDDVDEECDKLKNIVSDVV